MAKHSHLHVQAWVKVDQDDFTTHEQILCQCEIQVAYHIKFYLFVLSTVWATMDGHFKVNNA